MALDAGNRDFEHRLAARASEIAVVFKETPHSIFGIDSGRHRNVLSIRLQPNEGMTLGVTIKGIADIQPRQMMDVEVTYEDGTTKTIECLCRVDTLDELEYIKAGGILHYVLRNLVTS